MRQVVGNLTLGIMRLGDPAGVPRDDQSSKTLEFQSRQQAAGDLGIPAPTSSLCLVLCTDQRNSDPAAASSGSKIRGQILSLHATTAKCSSHSPEASDRSSNAARWGLKMPHMQGLKSVSAAFSGVVLPALIRSTALLIRLTETIPWPHIV